MAWQFSMQYIIFIFILDSQKCSNILPEIIIYPDIFILLGSSKNMAKIVDVKLGSSVRLYCHFSTVKGCPQSEVWYFKQRGNYEPVKTIKIPDFKSYETSIMAHTLKINNFNSNDSGIYTCKPNDKNINEESFFTYVLDGIFDDINITPHIGTVNQWQDYKRMIIDPINIKFEKLQIEPFTVLKSLKFSFRILTSWDNWGPCEISERAKGIRRKLGKCRLHLIPHNHNNVNISINENFVNNCLGIINNYYMIDNYDISCRSIKLNEYLPKISNIVRYLPEYEATEMCDKSYNVRDTNIGSTEIAKYLKHFITKQIPENGHCTLLCPQITKESNVQWYKNNQLLNFSYRNNMAEHEEEPHITIDSYSLYILHATKNEEGTYMCTVDEKPMQTFDLKVVAKSKLLNDEFIRYSIYLGFVLSLTITCYCAGICVAWHRRTSFADPLYLHIKKTGK